MKKKIFIGILIVIIIIIIVGVIIISLDTEKNKKDNAKTNEKVVEPVIEPEKIIKEETENNADIKKEEVIEEPKKENKNKETNSKKTTSSKGTNNTPSNNSNIDNNIQNDNDNNANNISDKSCTPKKFIWSFLRADFDNFQDCQNMGNKYMPTYGYRCDNFQDDCGDTYYMLTLFEPNTANEYDYHTIPLP